MPKMIYCANCGAKIEDEHDAACPHCGYIYEPGAEEQYMDSLEEMRKTLDESDEAAVGEYREDVKKNVRHLSKAMMICVAAVLVLFIVVAVYNKYFSYSAKRDRQNAEEMSEMVWEHDYFGTMDELYEAKDYDGLVDGLILSEEVDGHNVWDYEHYEFVNTYSIYKELVEDFVPALDSNEQLLEIMLGDYIFDMNVFYFRQYADEYAGCNEEEIAILDGYRDEVMDIMHDKLGISDDEMDAYLTEYNRVSEGYLSYSACDEIAEKYLNEKQ